MHYAYQYVDENTQYIDETLIYSTINDMMSGGLRIYGAEDEIYGE